MDYVAAADPGCPLQLQIGLRLRRSPVRAVHLAALLAADGDAPSGSVRCRRSSSCPRPTPGLTSGYLRVVALLSWGWAAVLAARVLTTASAP